MPKKKRHRKHKLAAKSPTTVGSASPATATISSDSIAAVTADLGTPSVPIRGLQEMALAIGKLPAWRAYSGTGHVAFLRTTDAGWYMGYSGGIDAALDSAITSILTGSNYSIMTKLHTPVVDEFRRVTLALEGERKSGGGDLAHGLNLGCAEKKLFSFLHRSDFEYESDSLMVYRVTGDTAVVARPCASCALCIAKYLDLWTAAAQRKKDEADGWTMATGKKRHGH